jgi:hypothetical protein
MAEPDDIVMYDAPGLVTVETRTLTGYWDANGRLWENAPSGEHMARYVACTHVRCNTCGAPTPKVWLMCADCRDGKAASEHATLPTAEWDGVTLLHSYVTDRYYGSPREAEDDLEDGQTLGDLRLTICNPHFGRELDAVDNFEDCLPEDGDVPGEIQAAVDALNRVIRAHGPLSYSPGKIALRIDEAPSQPEGERP